MDIASTAGQNALKQLPGFRADTHRPPELPYALESAGFMKYPGCSACQKKASKEVFENGFLSDGDCQTAAENLEFVGRH